MGSRKGECGVKSFTPIPFPDDVVGQQQEKKGWDNELKNMGKQQWMGAAKETVYSRRREWSTAMATASVQGRHAAVLRERTRH